MLREMIQDAREALLITASEAAMILAVPVLEAIANRVPPSLLRDAGLRLESEEASEMDRTRQALADSGFGLRAFTSAPYLLIGELRRQQQAQLFQTEVKREAIARLVALIHDIGIEYVTEPEEKDLLAACRTMSTFGTYYASKKHEKAASDRGHIALHEAVESRLPMLR